MFNFNFLADAGNYEDRKVARVEAEDNYGVGVSTCWTSDEGYETALIDANGVIPVERYGSKKEAIAGHEKWVKKSRTAKRVKKISWSDMPELDERVSIKRVLKDTNL